jgi:hypothetical protein
MFLCCGPSHYLIQLPRYDQVLTGIVPYDDSGFPSIFRRSKRPSRPTDPSQNQWLQDPVWDTIVTCWSNKPEQRYELSVMHNTFSMPANETRLRQRGKILQRIASAFRLPRNSEPEIERLVNEMDKVASTCTLPPMANIGSSVWEIPLCRTGNE